MSFPVFFRSFKQLHLKAALAACLVVLISSAFTFAESRLKESRLTDEMIAKGIEAEKQGNYLLARQNFDCALLLARSSGDKLRLRAALLDSARIDSEFCEYSLANLMAEEAVELSRKLYGDESVENAEAVCTLAGTISDAGQALLLYKKALATYGVKLGAQSCEYARTLAEISYCYENKGEQAAAISALKSARAILEKNGDKSSCDYARVIEHYATLVDLSEAEKISLLDLALSIEENVLGLAHPQLACTLSLRAASETDPLKKTLLLEQAASINEHVFGFKSYQLTRDLSALADALETAGNKERACDLRKRASQFYKDQKSDIYAWSKEFMQEYAQLLHGLKFEKEALRIDRILTNKEKQENRENSKSPSDRENDPEYWGRTEIVPLISAEKFRTPYYNYIQVIYNRGELELQAFQDGELLYKKNFAKCPGGILYVTASASDSITVSWRDGAGPVWHNDSYQIGYEKISLQKSTITDAYARQIELQLDEVVNGDGEAVQEGSVERVPAKYINNEFLSSAIRKAERKALKLYSQQDAATAAARLSNVFDLTAIAINNKRNDFAGKVDGTPLETWLDAWTFQKLPVRDYITAVNDYGFFLQQSGRLQESSQILKEVTRVCPKRAVAYLNLADSYWGLGQIEDAKKSYRHYLSLINEGSDKRSVPQRVYQRLLAEIS